MFRGPGGAGSRRGPRRARRGWGRQNAWWLIAVVALIPIYLLVETYAQWERRDLMIEDVAVLTAGEQAVGDDVRWRLRGLRDLTPERDWPAGTRLVVVDLDHQGSLDACTVRLTDSEGRQWEGSVPDLGTVELDTPNTCPYDGSDDAPKPGEWFRIAVPFIVPSDAEGLRPEVSLDPTSAGEEVRWARLAPG